MESDYLSMDYQPKPSEENNKTHKKDNKTDDIYKGERNHKLTDNECPRRHFTSASDNRAWGGDPHNTVTSVTPCDGDSSWYKEPGNQEDCFVRRDSGLRASSRPVSCSSISSSLPTSLPAIVTSVVEDSTHIRTTSDDASTTNNDNHQVAGLLTTSSCASLDSKGNSHSPVSRFLPRLLRNSFSKIRDSIPLRSKSIDLLKSNSEIDNSEPETSTSDIISPIDEEMVNESIKQGLPIIPFAYPNFVIVNKNEENTRSLLRENSQKDLKSSFSSVKEESVDGAYLNEKPQGERSFPDIGPLLFSRGERRRNTIIASCYQSENCPTACTEYEGFPGSKSDCTSYQHQPYYVEMSPQENNVFPIRNFETDPYMVMDHQKDKRKEREKYSYDETIFHLEQSNSSKEENKFLNHNYFHSQRYPFKPLSMFQRSEEKKIKEFEPLDTSERRRFKKGNKHKGDYVFIDLGMNKDYVSMGKSATWKSLSFYKIEIE